MYEDFLQAVQQLRKSLGEAVALYERWRRATIKLLALSFLGSAIILCAGLFSWPWPTALVGHLLAGVCTGRAIAHAQAMRGLRNDPLLGYPIKIHEWLSKKAKKRTPEEQAEYERREELERMARGKPGFAPPEHSEFFERERA